MNHDKIIESYIKETSERLKTKQRTLLIDDTPTEGSDNPVTSDGIKKYMDAKPSGGTEIEINKDQATDVLTGLQIDGDKYQVEEATPVEANGDVGDNYNYIASLTVNSNSYSFQKAPSDMDTSCDSIDTQIHQYGSTWSRKGWLGLDPDNNYIWTDGDNIYHSNGSNHYVLNKATSTWTPKTWSGLPNFYGKYIWTDGENIYYSESSNQYVLNKATSTWTPKTWSGLTDFSGGNIWTDGENIYYSGGSSIQYVLNKAISTWFPKTWNGYTNFDGANIWTDGENIYYSFESNQYVLDKSTSTWNLKIWNDMTYFRGEYIWTDGNNIYYSDYYYSQYILDKSTSTWSPKSWSDLTRFYGSGVWTDGEDIYYSNDSTQYVLNKNSLHSVKTRLDRTNGIKINTDSSSTQTLQNFVYKNIRYEIQQLQPPSNIPVNNTKTENRTFESTWERISDSLPTQSGSSVWTDGKDIYYSGGSNQYVLDKATSTWLEKTWGGDLANFDGYNIWTDGENIYYSVYTTQFILDKTTSTWNRKAWSGFAHVSGYSIWTDGENIYYSVNSDHYVLDKSTSTWNQKTWNGLTNFDGHMIWTDGENIYYSYYSNQYVLDKTTSTWSLKTWNGLTSFLGGSIWTDGENIYYSFNSNQQYVLDKATLTWTLKTWNGLTSFLGGSIWTDGENIYYNGGYKLKKNTLLGTDRLSQVIIPNNDNAVASSTSLRSVTIDGMPYRIGFNEYILLVQNLGQNGSTVIQWDAPSLDYFSNNTTTLSYLISVNGTFVAETQNTTYDLSGHLVSGENTVSIATKINTAGQQGSTIEVTK